MPNYVSKVVYGNETLIDITDTTAVASAVLSGYRFYTAAGASASGACNFDTYTGDATAAAGEILSGKTAYVNKNKVTGSMPNIGKQESTLSSRDVAVAIQAGYHDGSGSIGLNSTDKAALTSNNIREGVTILGVVGTMSGSEDVKATTKTATPYTTAKTYLPSGEGDYNYFSQVTVDAIAYSTTLNPQGGITATIGTVAPA